jgi:uncharacterized protein (DUF885 family)
VPDEIAPNYTTGAYYGVPIGAKNGGEYWVNTYALELEDLRAFRRTLGFSAFWEGWGLYSEKLGVEMGVYKTPYEHFGRLSYEMWRACRLATDTGNHSQNWTRRQAIDYLMNNTAPSAANVRAEINRYISWPGQALSYKLGELKIWELWCRAESELGSAFDSRAFHDIVLGHGELPLSMLDAEIGRFIDRSLDSRQH